MYVIPQIDHHKALKLLARPPRPLARKRKILKAELVYMPNFIFIVEIERKKTRIAESKISVDGIEGAFALYKDVPTTEEAPKSVKCPDFVISREDAQAIGLDEFRRFLLRHSLHRKEKAVVKSIRFDKEVYYPFWVGYFHRKEAYDFEVIDAVSGQRQGVKMKPVFIKALLADEGGTL